MFPYEKGKAVINSWKVFFDKEKKEEISRQFSFLFF